MSPSSKFPQITHAPPLTEVVDYQGGSLPVYIYRAAPGTLTSAAAWQIERLEYQGGKYWRTQYAGGGAFDQVADDRTELEYA